MQIDQQTTLVPKQNIELVMPQGYNHVLIVGDVPYNPISTLPFTNAHYGTLAGILRKCEISIENCAVTNVLPYYPDNGLITYADNTAVANTMATLKAFVKSYNPRVIIFLGRQTLGFFKLQADCLDDERGAPFMWENTVSVATYHPRELYAEWHNYPIVEADFLKAMRYSRDGWTKPVYDITYQPSFAECLAYLHFIINERPYLAVDIETQGNYMTCVGFAQNGRKAFVIPFVREGNKDYFTLEEETVIWKYLSRALEVGKFVGQNAVHYDHWWLAYYAKILLNVVDDTMFAQWSVYAEMPKSLAFINSLYLDNPYWKDTLKLSRSGKIPRNKEFEYNGLDNVLTMQGAIALGKEMKELPPGVRDFYKFKIRISRVFQYMSLRGCRINRDLLRDRIGQLEIQAEVDTDKFYTEAGKKLNVSSPKQMKLWLYDELKLPVRYKPVKQDDGSIEEKETADFLTCAYLAREYPSIPALMYAANLRKLKKRISSLKSIETSPTGEAYWNFNAVGTETGRAAGYKPYCGWGVQPQNPDKRDRDLFEPPLPGQVWAKCDLEGADAWTVAGEMAVLGDDTMLKDLLAGLKPALILAICYHVDQDLITADQTTLLAYAKQYKPFFKTPVGKQVYDTTKAVSHGTHYMMQAKMMHVTIFQKSKAELYIPVKQCEALRQLYIKRYKGLEKTYQYVPTLLNTHGYLDCPSGMRRVFFGRNDNHRTRVGLALIPQNNTAYATDRMLHNIFYSDYNRRGSSQDLIVQPINQVHDEGDLAFFPEELETVQEIFTKATDFSSNVWGVNFKIPFDPNYGPNWGKCDIPMFSED